MALPASRPRGTGSSSEAGEVLEVADAELAKLLDRSDALERTDGSEGRQGSEGDKA
jgi:hypothetical protein